MLGAQARQGAGRAGSAQRGVGLKMTMASTKEEKATLTALAKQHMDCMDNQDLMPRNRVLDRVLMKCIPGCTTVDEVVEKVADCAATRVQIGHVMRGRRTAISQAVAAFMKTCFHYLYDDEGNLDKAQALKGG